MVRAFIFMHPAVEKELCGMEEWQLGGALWMVSTTDSTPRHDGQLTAIDDTIHYGNLWCCAGCEPQNATCTRGQVRFSITIAAQSLELRHFMENVTSGLCSKLGDETTGLWSDVVGFYDYRIFFCFLERFSNLL